MKKGRMGIVVLLSLLRFLTACGTEKPAKQDSGTVPGELEYIPEGYRQPSKHPGTLEKLTYQTWESFSYKEQTQKLAKEAWVYLPYGYSQEHSQ